MADAHDETDMQVVKDKFTSMAAAGGRLIDPQHSVSSERTNKANMRVLEYPSCCVAVLREPICNSVLLSTG